MFFKDNPVYMDYNATTPVSPEVTVSMLPYMTVHFGNPNSSHYYGTRAKEGLENARKQIAILLNCKSSEITFTSGSTEAINQIIKCGALQMRRKTGKNHIITTKAEHYAVINACKYLEKLDFRVTYLDVDKYAIICPDDLSAALTPQTIMVCVIHSNNEVGSINPISECVNIVKMFNSDILFFSDTSQSVGKIPVDVQGLGVDFAVISGHKLYAPKGVGALYSREPFKLEPLLVGASQENGLRAGTQNVIFNVALGAACDLAHKELASRVKYLRNLRDELYSQICNGLALYSHRVRVNGHPYLRLPNTLSISFYGITVPDIMNLISNDVACSTGTACKTMDGKLSHVLTAMGVDPKWGTGTLRLSVGSFVTKNDINHVSRSLIKALTQLFSENPISKL